jgi:hypothetical protein
MPPCKSAAGDAGQGACGDGRFATPVRKGESPAAVHAREDFSEDILVKTL